MTVSWILPKPWSSSFSKTHEWRSRVMTWGPQGDLFFPSSLRQKVFLYAKWFTKSGFFRSQTGANYILGKRGDGFEWLQSGFYSTIFAPLYKITVTTWVHYRLESEPACQNWTNHEQRSSWWTLVVEVMHYAQVCREQVKGGWNKSLESRTTWLLIRCISPQIISTFRRGASHSKNSLVPRANSTKLSRLLLAMNAFYLSQDSLLVGWLILSSTSSSFRDPATNKGLRCFNYFLELPRQKLSSRERDPRIASFISFALPQTLQMICSKQKRTVSNRKQSQTEKAKATGKR